MIAHLKGVLTVKEPHGLVVDVHGVGYSVAVAGSTLNRLPGQGEPVMLFIHTHTSERGMELMGFLSEEERQVFRLLIGVSGVGPRVALGILSAMTPGRLVRSVLKEDIASLVGIPGIGRKTAQRLCVELADRFAKLELIQAEMEAAEEPGSKTGGEPDLRLDDVRSALINLGYRSSHIDAVMAELKRKTTDGAGIEQLIVEGLRLLQRP